MRLLLDSHAVVWGVDDVSKLGPAAATALGNPMSVLLLSAATVWEIAIKVGLGKLSVAQPYAKWMNQAIADLALTVLPVTVEYADAQRALPWHHRDPFDRLIISQALTENVPIVSADATLDLYGVTRVW